MSHREEFERCADLFSGSTLAYINAMGALERAFRAVSREVARCLLHGSKAAHRRQKAIRRERRAQAMSPAGNICS